MARKNNRNAQGNGSIRQRSDGRWEARYVAGSDLGTGKPIRRSIYGDTEGEVRKKLTAVIHSLDIGTYNAPQKMTVSKWLKIWLDEYVTHSVKPLTLASYKNHVNNHIIPALGAVEIQALKAHQIQNLYNSLLKGSADKKPLAPKSIKNLAAVIHKALAQSVKLGYINANPAAACELPRIEKKEIQPLEQAKMTEFLKATENDIYKNLFTVTLFTGMRQGEVLGLSWPCVDFEKGQITISQQLQKSKGTTSRIKVAFEPLVKDKTITTAQRDKITSAFLKGASGAAGYITKLDKIVTAGIITKEQRAAVEKIITDTADLRDGIKNEYYLASTKSGKVRVIKPAPFVMQTLRQERAKQTECKLRAGESWRNKDQLVFTNEYGGHLAMLTVYNHFKRVAARIGIPDARFHDLRHTYATAALSNGDDIKTVQTNLGHATASFTLDVYAHASEKMKQESADRMQKFILEVSKQA